MDSYKCQTFAVSPAEPGNSHFWLTAKAVVQRSIISINFEPTSHATHAASNDCHAYRPIAHRPKTPEPSSNPDLPARLKLPDADSPPMVSIPGVALTADLADGKTRKNSPLETAKYPA